MSEKEKMIAGEIYNPADAELYYERIKVKTLCQKYNQLNPSDTETRKKTLKQIFGKTGENPYIEPAFSVITATISKSGITSTLTTIL